MAARAYDLAAMQPHEVLELGARLRSECTTATSADGVAQRAVAVLFEALHDGARDPALALVRLYRTTDCGSLADDLRRAAQRLAPDVELLPTTRCLALAATRGIRAEWNEPSRATRFRVLPMPTLAVLQRFPIAVRMIAQFGFDARRFIDPAGGPPDPDPRRFRVFHVEDAQLADWLLAQDEFVRPFAIRSILGLGGLLPGGDAFGLLAFSRVRVVPELAQLFGVLAAQLELAFMDAAGEPRASEPRVGVLEQLVLLQESIGITQIRRLSDARASVQAESAELLLRRASEVEAQNRKLARTQRAMLNVVEDLRHARATLADQVHARTAELAETAEALRARNRELEEFAYIASHDLQEPLRTVSGYLQLFERRYRDLVDDQGREFIQFGIDGARRMQDLIEGLLSYTRVTTKAQPMTTVRLDDALDGAVHNLGSRIAESQARIDRGPLPPVLGDVVQLIQVFQNLISNSIKFAGAAAPRVDVRAERRGDEVEVAVADRGVGFDPRHSEKVLKMFTRLRRDTPGTGVGLAICKKIIERHGGRIAVESQPGAGVTVRFTLPASQDSP